MVVAALVLGATTGSGKYRPILMPLDAGGYGLLLAAVLPLLWRTSYPLAVFVVTMAVALIYHRTDYPPGPVIAGAIIALFTFAMRAGPWRAGAAAGVGLLGAYVSYVLGGNPWLPHVAATGFLALAAAVVAFGTAARARAAAVRASRERAVEREQRLAEEERLRVAREVHDVVAHSLAMINVQAGVAAHVADRKPEQAKEALLAIKDASRTALHDLRAALGVLRTGDRAPVPSLDRVDELIDATSSTGLRVDLHGDPGELPAQVGAAAYRIVQESLTNVVRHARDATAAVVRLTRREDMLVIEVSDDGAPPEEVHGGNGLRGMRERAEALGGTLVAAPGERGFLVRAELPLQGTDE